MLRSALGRLHRWLGLGIAGFLFVSGLTGAVISWDHELDELLNPHLLKAVGTDPAIPSLELAAAVEARDPRVRVTYVPLTPEPGHALLLGVEPRVDPATGHLFEPGYNQVFIDPASGAELGRRQWGATWPISRETLVSFLYVLHYSLHVPELGHIPWGMLLLGVVAMVWTADCFVGFYITLPVRQVPHPGRAARGWWARWQPAWRIKTAGSPFRIAFDVHRAFSLWTWALLFVLAFTAFSLNLYREVFYPVMSLVSEVTPTPFDLREPVDHEQPIEPRVGFAAVIEAGAAEASGRGWEEPVGAAFYSPEFGIYALGFFHPGGDHGQAGVGPALLYYDGGNGSLLGGQVPWQGTAADIFVQAQFPLHSGRILGLPGRILVSLMGLVVATLSVTGVVVWARKRRARLLTGRLRPAAAAFAPEARVSGRLRP